MKTCEAKLIIIIIIISVRGNDGVQTTTTKDNMRSRGGLRGGLTRTAHIIWSGCSSLAVRTAAMLGVSTATYGMFCNKRVGGKLHKKFIATYGL